MRILLTVLWAMLVGHGDPVPVAATSRRIAIAPAETLAVTQYTAVTGDSTLIVLITGPVGSAFSMRRVSEGLAALGYAVVVIDPLGMGASSRPADADYSLGMQARRVRALLERIQPAPKQTLMVGHGTSATIALHYLADDPTDVIGLVSIAGGIVDRQGTSGVNLALALAPLLDTRIGRSIGRRRFASAARAQSGDPTWVTEATIDAYLAPVEANLRETLRALKHMHDATESTPIAQRLPDIDRPVHLVVGDKPVPNAPSRQQIASMQRALRLFRVDTLVGAGTMVHEERAPDLIRIIDDMARKGRTVPRALQLELPRR